MKKVDFLLHYLALAPMQISLVRFLEAYEMSKLPFKKPILDVGCNDGVFGEVLFGKRGMVDVGIDVDTKALKLAKKRTVYQKVLEVDARKLPFKNRSFATVFSNQSLEHIKKVEKVISEINRVLTPGGKFILLVPTVYLKDYWVAPGFLYDLRNKLFKHYNLWGYKKWQKLLKENGFLIESYKYVGNKKNYFISEFFWPVRMVEMVIEKVFGKEFLLPRRLSLFWGRLILKYLNKAEEESPSVGPTVLIIARKLMV